MSKDQRLILRESINNTVQEVRKRNSFLSHAIKDLRDREDCDRALEASQIHDEMLDRNELLVDVDANHC